jgi:membrane protease subunit HflK
VILIGILAAWFALDSWRTIDEAERGVVLRFGEYNRTMGPGLNLKWPGPIEQVFVVEAMRVRSTSDQVRMLTRDENIIAVDFNVQYIVADPRAFLFTLRDPDLTIREAAESAVRQVIGSSTMSDILAGRITELSTNARTVLQELLDDYSRARQQPGEGEALRPFFQVNEVNFQNVRPPPEVKEAFDDAIIAREDKQRAESEAQAYASQVVPEARGQAARVRAEAEGARESLLATAEGEAERFSLLLTQYRLAPEITRKRLMLETMQEVLSGSPKVIVEGGGEKILYLPLDKISQGANGAPSGLPSPIAMPQSTNVPAVEAARGRDATRTGREGRN